MTNRGAYPLLAWVVTLGLSLLPISCVENSEMRSSASHVDGGPTFEGMPSDAALDAQSRPSGPASDAQAMLPATPTTDADVTAPDSPGRDAQLPTPSASECPDEVHADFEGACVGEASCWYPTWLPEDEFCVDEVCFGDIGYQVDCVDGEWQVEDVHYDGAPDDHCDAGDCDAGGGLRRCDSGYCDAGF